MLYIHILLAFSGIRSHADMGPGSSSGLDITMALGSNQAIKSPTSAHSSLLSFSPREMNRSLSPVPHHTFAHHNSACDFSLEPGQIALAWACVWI